MTSPTRFFAASYGEARKKFLDACRQAEATPETLQNPHANGPYGEPLYTDIVRIGPAPEEGGRALLICVSGTHGNEGFCGSACQTGFLREDMQNALPEGVAVLFVHGINPYGFAHIRRVTEDNIDLNRNFLSHNGTYPDSSAYEALHPHLCPPDLFARKDDYDAKLLGFIEEKGLPAFQAAVSGGQYSKPDGLFFGGNAACWSNRTWREVTARHGAGYAHVGVLDFHTGLGEYGHGELIFGGIDAEGMARGGTWFPGEVTSDKDGSSVSAPIQGDLASAVREALPRAQVTPFVIEYGTRDLRTVLEAFRADNWLYLHGDPESDEGRAVKAQVKDALYPEEDAWKEKVWARAADIFGKMAAGLARS